MKNYYTILQVKSDADSAEIRQAFRRLSKEYHPDRHGGGRYYEEKFKEINEAYQTLRDPIRRWQYKQDSQRPSAGPSRPGRNWDTPDYASMHRRTQSRRQASYRPAGGPTAGSSGWSDFRAAVWSVVLIMVFLLPFRLAERASESPAEKTTEKREWVKLEQPAAATVQLTASPGPRYERDVHLLKEIRRIDPGLKNLDLETGYYVLRGESIRLSWQVLQLIREKHWKYN